MSESWERLLARWTEAGVIDAGAAERVRAFEKARTGGGRLRWPIWLALVFGGLAIGSGVLLFVSAHWDTLSPVARFVTVLAMVAAFHVAAAVVSSRQSAMGMALHTVGTVACGAGVFLAGQIFNLSEHWPSGMLFWSVAAVVAWTLLRDWTQFALVALLVPAWLLTEWIVASERAFNQGARVFTAGLFLLALAYFSAPGRGRSRGYRRMLSTGYRRVLFWIGGLAILPSAMALASAPIPGSGQVGMQSVDIPPETMAIGWCVAIGLPAIVALVLQRLDAWPNLVATLWVAALFAIRSTQTTVPVFAWWALGAAALAASGIRDGRTERINIGVVIFAATVVAFYFSEVMTKMGRSASLIGLGVLFLAGGWALERARRRFVRQARGASSS